MQLGGTLYRISRRRFAFGLSLLVAVLACSFTLYSPSLSPPGLHARRLQVAAASTELLVATPSLAVAGPADYLSLVNRSILVGNVMASGPVLAYISHALGVPSSAIQATAPMTANVPRTLVEPNSGSNATAIMDLPDQYKLEIQADPAAPILHVYAQAPTAKQAITLATAAVAGVTAYLHSSQTSARVPAGQQVRVEPLGPVQGGVANPGAPIEIVVLVFVGTFGLVLWLIVIGDKVRRGWVAARLETQLQP